MKFLSLFSGIGGLDLGLERAGMRCVGQVEIDPFALRVPAKNFPHVPRWTDVRKFTRRSFDGHVDLVAGGFPCQDISLAGKGAGITGVRSRLWSQMRRIIRVFRPRFVLVENVSALLGRGMGVVLGDLANMGFDAEWGCLPAAAVGAPHLRERVFIVAYPNSLNGRAGRAGRPVRDRQGTAKPPLRVQVFPDAHGQRRAQFHDAAEPVGTPVIDRIHHAGGDAALDPDRQPARSTQEEGDEQKGWWPELIRGRWEARGPWSVEPALGRVADGIPDRVDRLRGIGNAVVPQVAEWIGRRILAVDTVHGCEVAS